MAFWTDATLQDPKRGYRFLVDLGRMPNGATWYAKSVKKPSFSRDFCRRSYPSLPASSLTSRLILL